MKGSNEYEYLPTIEGNRVVANTPSDGNSKNINRRKTHSTFEATRLMEMERKNIQNVPAKADFDVVGCGSKSRF